MGALHSTSQVRCTPVTPGHLSGKLFSHAGMQMGHSLECLQRSLLHQSDIPIVCSCLCLKGFLQSLCHEARWHKDGCWVIAQLSSNASQGAYQRMVHPLPPLAHHDSSQSLSGRCWRWRLAAALSWHRMAGRSLQAALTNNSHRGSAISRATAWHGLLLMLP